MRLGSSGRLRQVSITEMNVPSRFTVADIDSFLNSDMASILAGS